MQRSNTQYTKRNYIEFEGILELEMEVVSDYLHVGSGLYDVQIIKPLDNIDQAVNDALSSCKIPDLTNYFSPLVHEMNRYQDKVVIPGSTIKGLVRSRLELSIKDACFIVSRPSNGSSETYKQIFKYPKPRRSDRFPLSVCPVCDLLGNSGLGSRVSFSDFVMTQGKIDYINVRGEYYESALKGSKFRGRVVYHSLHDADLGMLLYGLGFRLKDGQLKGKVMLMGRFKYSDRRFGRVVFSLVSPQPIHVQVLRDFIVMYHPLDFKEDW